MVLSLCFQGQICLNPLFSLFEVLPYHFVVVFKEMSGSSFSSDRHRDSSFCKGLIATFNCSVNILLDKVLANKANLINYECGHSIINTTCAQISNYKMGYFCKEIPFLGHIIVCSPENLLHFYSTKRIVWCPYTHH